MCPAATLCCVYVPVRFELPHRIQQNGRRRSGGVTASCRERGSPGNAMTRADPSSVDTRGQREGSFVFWRMVILV